MRTSFLSRSVIAVASLAIGSAALAATPATAASATGITREMVLIITAEARIADGEHTSSLERKVSRLAARACNVEIDGWTSLDSWNVKPVETGNVDGLLVSVELHEVSENLEETTHRQCTFAVLTTTDPAFTLSGNGSVSVETLTYDEATETQVPGAGAAATSALSGDVFVTGPVLFNSDISSIAAASFSASGNAKRPFEVTTQQKVATPKSKAAKKAAKKAYAKKLKSAKKAYAKALKKAGSSKSKKASAKKAYAAKRAAAKAAYNKAVATSKVVSNTTQQAENRPFNVSASFTAINP